MNLAERLDAATIGAIDEGRIVGSVIIVRRHGELVYQAAHGLGDRENRRPMTLDAIFRLSSLTKPIVAATILALIEDGKLGLDAAVTDYLPDFRPRLADGARASPSGNCSPTPPAFPLRRYSPQPKQRQA